LNGKYAQFPGDRLALDFRAMPLPPKTTKQPLPKIQIPFPTSGMDKLRQIFLASRFGISEWRGIASIAPVFGFDQSE
jgi:hypothetical protein